MYNNEVTYADKWNTPENEKAYTILEKKYFENSYCYPSCPTAWAPEVLELMEVLDRELGIERNEETLGSYFPQGDIKDWFIINPFKGLLKAFRSQFLEKAIIRDRNIKDDYVLIPKTLKEKFFLLYKSFTHPIKYGFKVLKVTKVNPILNKIKKPKLRLTQLKEKYGELRIYFNCPPAFEQWVEQEIAKCEIKLAMKGAYFPIEYFWNYAIGYTVGSESEPDTITTSECAYSKYNGKPCISVNRTTHRKAMKELGLNLADIELKAMEAAAKEDKFE